MCHYVTSEVKTAPYDMVYYKVVEKSNDGRMFTPYQNMLIEYNVNYTLNTNIDDFGFDKNDMLENGWFHLFADKNEVDYFLSLRDKCYHWFVIKAIIPKGTKFYLGYFRTLDGCFDSIATKSVIYKPLD